MFGTGTTTVAALGVAALSLLVASCGGGLQPAASGNRTATTVRVASGASEGDSTSRSFRTVPFAELQTFLAAAGVRRVDIEFGRRRDEVEDPDEVLDDEKVEGWIIGITGDAGGTSGRIVVQLAGALSVEVSFTAATEFKVEGTVTEELTLGQFVARVQAALNRGERPPVEGERGPLRDALGEIVAQGPGDPTFVVPKIELEEYTEDKIEINVDGGSVSDTTLTACGLAQGIQVLGICVEIVPGVTVIEIEIDD